MSDTPKNSGPLRMTAVIVGTLLGMICIFAGLAVMVRPEALPTQPQLLAETRAVDQAALSSYGWIDREKGIVRIPVELAMEKVLKEGTRPTPRGAQ